jgi:hypothetical protein
MSTKFFQGYKLRSSIEPVVDFDMLISIGKPGDYYIIERPWHVILGKIQRTNYLNKKKTVYPWGSFAIKQITFDDVVNRIIRFQPEISAFL